MTTPDPNVGIDFATIRKLRQAEQRRRGLPVTDDTIGMDTQGGTAAPPDPRLLQFQQQGIGSLPVDPRADVELMDQRASAKSSAIYQDIIEPASTLRPETNKIAEKYAALDLFGMGGPVPPAGGGV